MTIETCYRCARAATSEAGTIYVRREVDGRFRSIPICDTCWQIEQPGREPVRVRP
jgi:hypothetical protein